MARCLFGVLLIFSLHFGFSQSDTIVNESFDFVNKPWVAVAEVTSLNIIVNRFDWHVSNFEWANVTPDTWQSNLTAGLEWDWNAFMNNWFHHPYNGSLYFNAARHTGHNYWASSAFAVGGSMMWEYFAERYRPSGNDLGTTVLGGMFLGEAFHRISDKLMRHPSRGFGKVWRTGLCTIINPMRMLNRWLAGKPQNALAMHNPYSKIGALETQVSAGTHFMLGNYNAESSKNGPYLMFNMIYGNPFEDKSFYKPFDVFEFRSWWRMFKNAENPELFQSFRFANIFLNIDGFGNYWAKNIHYSDKAIHMFGIFHQYSYVHNEVMELGYVGSTAGLFSKFIFNENCHLRTFAHFGPSILGGSTSEIVGDFHEGDNDLRREYVLGPGIIAKAEAKLYHSVFGNFIGRVTHLTTYILTGPNGSENVGLIDLRYEYPLFKKVHLGVNYTQYLRYVDYRDFPDYSDYKRSMYELKVYLALNL